ncbi:hypothetical protein ACQP1S_30715 [Micromonospora matsumotoense]|uniref:hypothetical protein n=1 Tax=Micromonospora matsumotoense TaxID=121616 RepID=UPI003D8C388F
MIEVLLGEVGRRINDRWLTRALGPGLLWCAVAAFAVLPGRSAVFDVHGAALAAADALDHLKDRVSLAVVVGSLVVAAAAAAAVCAQAAGRVARHVWLGSWPGPAGRVAVAVTARRRAAAVRRIAAQRRVVPAVYLPARPTWIGDRIRLADDRVAAQYGLRLGLIWSRLWLLLGADGRTDVMQARDRLDRAVTSAGWAVLHLALTPWWWPAVLLGATLGAVSWWRARSAAGLFADLVEATVDLRHRNLVAELGFPVEEGRPVPPSTAAAVNDLLHKGASGHGHEARTGAESEPTS